MVLVRETELPRLSASYARAVIQSLRATRLVSGRTVGSADVPSSPATSFAGRVVVSGDRLARYRDVCGFGPGSDVPATYPHVLAFPLQLRLMTAPTFPFPAMGLVHIANSIVQEQQLSTADALDLSVFATDLRPHRRGRQVTVVTQATVSGEPVWREHSVFLSRSQPTAGASQTRQDGDEPAGEPASAPEVVTPSRWRLPAQLGRRYAFVSGDLNPIHLFDVTAKPFGYRSHIAHGMWTTARALAELTPRLPERFRVDVAFQTPLALPATVRFSATDNATRIGFDVRGVSAGPPGSLAAAHLVGTVARL